MFLATSSYSLASGTGTDQYGDETDVDTTMTEGVSGAVTETTRTSFDPASGRHGSVAVLVGRFRPGTTLSVGDRITDERTDESYTVTNVHNVRSGINTPDVVVELSSNS